MRLLTFTALSCLLLISPLVGPSRACTSFCFDTPDGPIYATNLDLMTGEGHVFVNRRGIAKEGYRASTTGETAHWVSLYGSVTFNLVGRELPWSGMNEAGLVMSTMQLNASRCPDADERPPLSEALLVQYMLDTCGSVREAIAAMVPVRLAQQECASHYMLADATGDCAAFEFLDGQLIVHHGETLPVQALANAPYAAGVDYMEQGLVPADNPGASVERVAAAADKMARYEPDQGVSPVDYSFGVLTETVVAPKKWWSDLFHEPYTRWNVVFDIDKQKVHFRTVKCPTVRHLSLSNLDFACEVPMLMLDVNAKLAGNVEGGFTAYDHEANLEIFRTFCDKWGIDVSKESAMALVALFESFECAP